MASGSQADYLLVEAEKPTSTDTLEVCTKKADHKEGARSLLGHCQSVSPINTAELWRKGLSRTPRHFPWKYGLQPAVMLE